MRFPICPHPCEHLLALFKKRFIYLFRTILGLRCCKLAFSSNIEWGLLLTTAHGLLFGWFILLRSMDAMACGIFPDQGSNLCPTALAGRFLTTGPPGKPLGLFDYSHPSKCGVVSHCGFDLHFPDGWWCRVSFTYLFSSVAQSCLTLWSHGLQPARFPCLSPTPRACSNSCPSSWWCRPTIASSVVPFSSCLRGLFQGVSSLHKLAKVLEFQLQHQSLPMKIQDWFPLGWTGWISLQSEGLSRVFSNTTVQKHKFFSTQLSLWSSSHIHTWLLEKP